MAGYDGDNLIHALPKFDVLPATDEVLNDLRQANVTIVPVATAARREAERLKVIAKVGENALGNGYVCTFDDTQKHLFEKVFEVSCRHINTTEYTKVHAFSRPFDLNRERHAERHLDTTTVFWAKQVRGLPALQCKTARKDAAYDRIRPNWVDLYECRPNNTHEPRKLSREEGAHLKPVDRVTSIDVCPSLHWTSFLSKELVLQTKRKGLQSPTATLSLSRLICLRRSGHGPFAAIICFSFFRVTSETDHCSLGVLGSLFFVSFDAAQCFRLSFLGVEFV